MFIHVHLRISCSVLLLFHKYVSIFLQHCTLHFLASRKGLEEQVKRLKSEKTAVNSELRLLEERYGNLEHELEKVQERNHTLMEAKADLEVGHITNDIVCGGRKFFHLHTNTK